MSATDPPQIGFESLGGTIDEYFKLYQVNVAQYYETKEQSDQVLKFVLDSIDSGKSAYEAFTELLKTRDDKKIIKTILKRLKPMYND